MEIKKEFETFIIKKNAKYRPGQEVYWISGGVIHCARVMYASVLGSEIVYYDGEGIVGYESHLFGSLLDLHNNCHTKLDSWSTVKELLYQLQKLKNCGCGNYDVKLCGMKPQQNILFVNHSDKTIGLV